MAASLAFFLTAAPFAASAAATGQVQPDWNKLGSDGPWSPREGLMGTATKDGILMSGGRSFFGTAFNNDVWLRKDGAATWVQQPKAPFGERAYHGMLELNGCVYVMGGQTFTQYLNDVWRSCDGAQSWSGLGTAPWPVRAGLAFTVHRGRMVVAGGCFPGPGIPPNNRAFYNDVWSSADGQNWTKTTGSAPWSARSGPRLVSFRDSLLLVAGERGFTPQQQLQDVWSSTDAGAHWSLVEATPAFSPRSGHSVVVLGSGTAAESLLLIAGWPHLHDAWASTDGAKWALVSNRTWNCAEDGCGKYDFWTVLDEQPGRDGRVVTFGGSNAYSTFGKLWSDTWECDTNTTTATAAVARLL